MCVIYRFHGLHGICHLDFYHFIYSVLVSRLVLNSCLLAYLLASIRRFELFALICLLFTAKTLIQNSSSNKEITLLSPHTHTLTADFSLMCTHFPTETRNVVTLERTNDFRFIFNNKYDALHFSYQIYTCHTRWHDDNDGNNNRRTNSSLYRLQLPISKSACK